MGMTLQSFHLLMRAAVLAVVVVLFAGEAEANSHTVWAPMCDLSAASVVAPLIAPPVEGGEITCPDGSMLEDFSHALLHQGGGPAGDPEPGSHSNAVSPRMLPANVFTVTTVVVTGELLDWPAVSLGPAVAFDLGPDRPPCS
jgi:hypothetical protein